MRVSTRVSCSAMIPVALPSIESLLLLFASLGAGVCLLIWLLRLLLSRRARSRFAARPVLGIVLMLVWRWPPATCHSNTRCGRLTANSRRDAARRVTLAQAQTLGGVLMPAGARLTLAKEGELETFTEALFDPPAPAFGLVSPASNATCTPTTIPRRTRSCAAIRTPSTCGARARRSRAGCAIRAETAPARGGRGNAARIRRMRAGRGNAIEGAWGTGRPEPSCCGWGGVVYTDGHREPVNWMVRVRDPLGLPLAG